MAAFSIAALLELKPGSIVAYRNPIVGAFLIIGLAQPIELTGGNLCRVRGYTVRHWTTPLIGRTETYNVVASELRVLWRRP